LQNYSQWISYGNSQDAPLLTNRLRKCVWIYNGSLFSHRRMKFCHLQANDGTGEHHLVKLSRFRKPKAACFLSYVEYRPNTNVAIL
jgi:hypothetical protein